MRLDRKSLASIVLPLMLLGCNVPPPEAMFEADDRLAVETLMTELAEALVAEDWARVANTFRGDAIMMPPGEPPVAGRPAIQEALERQDGVNFAAVSLVTEDIEGGAFLAFASGTYAQTFTTPTAEGNVTWSESGSWLAALQRDNVEPESPWGIYRFIWNRDVPHVPEVDTTQTSPPGADTTQASQGD